MVENAHALLENNFVFQQDGAPTHGAMRMQEWLGKHCPDFIDKDSWPPNSQIKSSGLLCMASNDRGIQQVKSKTTEHFWGEDSFADDYGISCLMKQSTKLSQAFKNDRMHV